MFFLNQNKIPMSVEEEHSRRSQESPFIINDPSEERGLLAQLSMNYWDNRKRYETGDMRIEDEM